MNNRQIPQWSTYIEYATHVADDVHDQMMDLLTDFEPAPTTTPNGNFAVMITTTTPTAERAYTEAVETIGTALRTVHGSAPIAAIEIMSTKERDRRYRAPDIPELTDVPGVGEILGISRAGAYKRVNSPEFQRQVPVATTVNGRPVFVVDHVRRYADIRTTGRPSKTPTDPQ
ncbi:hypothetical protein [Kitasatospora sp. NPDC087315]|uniref:hypothetical protein n=1 Tax=Kitasatospora sp. NPDC087315 TaxID=3364069 RepID=UPI0037FAF860